MRPIISVPSQALSFNEASCKVCKSCPCGGAAMTYTNTTKSQYRISFCRCICKDEHGTDIEDVLLRVCRPPMRSPKTLFEAPLSSSCTFCVCAYCLAATRQENYSLKQLGPAQGARMRDTSAWQVVGPDEKRKPCFRVLFKTDQALLGHLPAWMHTRATPAAPRYSRPTCTRLSIATLYRNSQLTPLNKNGSL